MDVVFVQHCCFYYFFCFASHNLHEDMVEGVPVYYAAVVGVFNEGFFKKEHPFAK